MVQADKGVGDQVPVLALVVERQIEESVGLARGDVEGLLLIIRSRGMHGYHRTRGRINTTRD